MAATNPYRVKDLLHTYGWDFIPRLAALGVQNIAEAQVLFVDSGATNALDADDAIHGHSFENPLATIDYAIGLCTASEQSIILLAPGHAESKAASGILNTVDIAGVKIIGLGQGTLRPTITLSGNTGAVAFSVTAANVLIENIRIVVSIDACVKAINVAASDCKLIDIEVQDNAVTTEAAIGILTTSAADNLYIKGYKHNGFLAGDACTEAISLIGVDRCVIEDSWFRGAFSTSAIQLVTTACSGVIVKDCTFENGTTALTKNVVDNAVSKWSAVHCWDVVGGYFFGGGSGAAVATDDTSALAAAVAAVSTTGVASAPTANTLADTLHKDGSFTYDNTTDSLEAIRDRIDALMPGTIGYFFGTGEANADTSTIVSSELAGWGDAFFVTDWVAVVIKDAGGAQAAPEGEIRDITAYTSATGTFTVGSAFSAAVTTGDEVMIARREIFSIDEVTLKTPATGSLATFIASGGTGLGQPLPASTSLVDLVGNFTGPYNGAAQDDNVKASLDLAHTDLDTIIANQGTLVNTGGTATIGGIFGDAANSSFVTRFGNIQTEVNKVGTITNTGGTASLGAVLGDVANVDVATRMIQGTPRLVSKAYADLTGYDTASAFTVTGDVLVQVFGVVGATPITSTSGTTTVSVGTTQAPQGIIANSTIDNTQFDATDVWVDSSPANDVEALAAQDWHVVGGGAAIVLSRSVDDITAGSLTLYCRYIPLSSGAAVVAA